MGYHFFEKMENPGRGGGGVLSELPSMLGVWIFSGTTQFKKQLVSLLLGSSLLLGFICSHVVLMLLSVVATFRGLLLSELYCNFNILPNEIWDFSSNYYFDFWYS